MPRHLRRLGADGNGLNQSLTCASDSYKFNLAGNVIARGGVLTGTWSEQPATSAETWKAAAAPASFRSIASAPGFTANISLRTQGNKQSVASRRKACFRAASISLTRS